MYHHMHMAKKLLADQVTIIQQFLFNCIGLTGRPARPASQQKALKTGRQVRLRASEVASEIGPMKSMTRGCREINSEKESGARMYRNLEELVSVL